VDTLGLIIGLVVHAGSIQDRTGAKAVFIGLLGNFPRLGLIWADGGYRGKLVDWVKAFCGWTLEIVKRSDHLKGFSILPKRWIVERTFGWLNFSRRLSKDYEHNCRSSEAMIYIAMIHLMTKRLA
jgi:putative transposase